MPHFCCNGRCGLTIRFSTGVGQRTQELMRAFPVKLETPPGCWPRQICQSAGTHSCFRPGIPLGALLLVGLFLCFANFAPAFDLGLLFGESGQLSLGKQELGGKWRTTEATELMPAAVNDPVAFWAIQAHGHA